MATSRKYIQVDVLDRIAALEMRAREIVEGTLAGLQRSPYRGVSAEFAQHRAYVFGDDTRHIDWKVYDIFTVTSGMRVGVPGISRKAGSCEQDGEDCMKFLHLSRLQRCLDTLASGGVVFCC